MNKNIEPRLLISILLVVFLSLLNPLMSFDDLIMANDIYNLERKDPTSTPYTPVQDRPFLNNVERIMGAYIPDALHLEEMEETGQTVAILEFLQEGFDEYYFVMDNFWDAEEIESTERLLDAVDNTGLKIVIILLPPSEGGPRSSYDWKGWVNYFNDLKTRHPSSFSGFAIDDFNWISTRNDTKFRRNIDFMIDSNLTDALVGKRSDVKFCPVVYFEGLGNQVVANEYGKYIDTLVWVSASYYNVSRLETNLSMFKEMFPGKPTRYIVYPTITYNYSRQGFDPPSDRLVMATLSIATRSVDGIILWHKIDGPLVRDYLNYRENPNYLHAIYVMEQLQIADEENTLLQTVNKQKIVEPYFSRVQFTLSR
ncbi:MAG TPA: hypothetical protein VKA87_02675 [Nitrososphaeraceae archaeon]|nr:hypothetical protein [Nitrososphaeraceae archaeon]